MHWSQMFDRWHLVNNRLISLPTIAVSRLKKIVSNTRKYKDSVKEANRTFQTSPEKKPQDISLCLELLITSTD